MRWPGYPVEVTTPRGVFELRGELEHGRMVAGCRHPEEMRFQVKGAPAGVFGCRGCMTVDLAVRVQPRDGRWLS